MNLIEKILARASGRREVEPGEIVIAEVDLMLPSRSQRELRSERVPRATSDMTIAHPERVAIVFDHTFSLRPKRPRKRYSRYDRSPDNTVSSMCSIAVREACITSFSRAVSGRRVRSSLAVIPIQRCTEPSAPFRRASATIPWRRSDWPREKPGSACPSASRFAGGNVNLSP